MNLNEFFRPDEIDSRLLEALDSLNQISYTINRLAPGDQINISETLQLIVESATRVIPGSSAVIYTYNEEAEVFDRESRVFAGPDGIPPVSPLLKVEDQPRLNGIGMRAIERQKRVISYEEIDIAIHPFHASLGVQAVCCFPLIVAFQAVGLLYVYIHEKREFSRLELLMLENFVNQAAMAIFHTRRLADMNRNLIRKEEELKQLRRASLLISSRLRLKDTLEAILQLALDITDGKYGIFRLLDRSGQNLITSAIAGENLDRPLIEALPIQANSVMGHVARSRETILIPDLHARPWSQIYYPLDAALEMRSELAVPIINASGRLEGVLNLESPTPGAFTENDRHMLQSLATYAVTAIQEVRLLDALQEVAALLLSQPSQRVLNRLSEVACDLLNTNSGAIWLVEKDELLLRSSWGAERKGERIPLHQSLAGLAVITKNAVVSDDVTNDSRFYRPDLAAKYSWQRALVVPLIGDKDSPIGAFAVYSTSLGSGRFADSDWDKKVLSFLAQYAVMAVQNEVRQQTLRAVQEQRSVAETFAAVGDIASNLLHHLNNKVGTIPVRVQSIEDKCASTIQADGYLAHNLNEIERCAMEAMQTVRDNLSHLRPIRIEPIFVAARVQEAIQKAQIPSTVQIQSIGLDRLPVVMAGAQSLTFVFTNLIENAANAMQGVGEIVIEGISKSSWVEITVRDSGPGINPELHDRIFELSFLGEKNQGSENLGFGLWWVKTLMTRLGGSVVVESDGQNGTTFRLTLPRSESREIK